MKTNPPSPDYKGYRFPSEIISHAVWLYFRFSLSFCDVEELLAQRGIIVTYETVCMDYEHHHFEVHPTSYTSKQAVFQWKKYFQKTSALSSNEKGEKGQSIKPRSSFRGFVRLPAVQKTTGGITTSEQAVMQVS
jgi:hypothetical protein